jgi:hypothetical protein
VSDCSEKCSYLREIFRRQSPAIQAQAFLAPKHVHDRPILCLHQPASHYYDAYIFGKSSGLDALGRKIEAALAGQPNDEEEMF